VAKKKVFSHIYSFRIANGDRKGTNPGDGFLDTLQMGSTLLWREAGNHLQNYPDESYPLL